MRSSRASCVQLFDCACSAGPFHETATRNIPVTDTNDTGIGLSKSVGGFVPSRGHAAVCGEACVVWVMG